MCNNTIGTKSFIPKENDIYCAGCYEDKFATKCIKCSRVITAGGVTYRNEPWHRECFTCRSVAVWRPVSCFTICMGASAICF